MSGYDALDDPNMRTSLYLSLKAKGDKVRVRLIGDPVNVISHWMEEASGKNVKVACSYKKGQPNKCTYCGDDIPANDRLKKNLQFSWVAIDRADGQVKVFQGSEGVAIAVRDLIKPESGWGPTEGYDITVERTEEPGKSYYKTTPIPPKPLTEEEKEAITKANIDLAEMVKDSRQSSKASGADELSDDELETVPETPVKTAEPAKAEDDGSINEEDIPF